MRATGRPGRVQLVGLRSGVDALLVEAGHCSPEQARQLAEAGAFGPGYAHGATVLWDREDVRAVADRPRLEVDHLPALLAGPDSPTLAVIARQGPRVDLPPGEDPTRGWYGVDLFAPPAEQRLASDRWWTLGEAKRRRLRDALNTAGQVPFIASLSGHVVGAYTILDLDDDPRFGLRFVLDEQPPPWAPHLLGRWLRTGRGAALLLLDLAAPTPTAAPAGDAEPATGAEHPAPEGESR